MSKTIGNLIAIGSFILLIMICHQFYKNKSAHGENAQSQQYPIKALIPFKPDNAIIEREVLSQDNQAENSSLSQLERAVRDYSDVVQKVKSGFQDNKKMDAGTTLEDVQIHNTSKTLTPDPQPTDSDHMAVESNRNSTVQKNLSRSDHHKICEATLETLTTLYQSWNKEQ